MRKGNHPEMVLDPKGHLLAIATGADFTSEHEWGSKELMEALTAGAAPDKEALARSLKAGKKVAMPDLMASKRITRNLSRIAYGERTDKGEREATVVFDAHTALLPFGNSFIDSELSFPRFSDPKDVAGAWDSRSFGFRVRGEKKVAQLREFVQALRDGKGIFAGTFLKQVGKQHLSGVTIAIEELLRPEHRAEMKKAQAEFESEVRLMAKARTAELLALARGVTGRSVGHIWPVWKDRVVDGDVMYALNPGYGVDAAYWGPYSFEQLQAWMKAGATSALRPLVPA